MIINVYKPKGWTSNDVVQKIKRVCGFKKVGHAGTLDPLAEGVLLVLTDEDTKKQNYFMNLKKEYFVELALGVVSDSHDLGTPVKLANIEKAFKISLNELNLVLRKYLGSFEQKVPAFSAVQKDGVRLYKLARSQKALDLPSKKVELFSYEIVNFGSTTIVGGFSCPVAKIKIECSKGFYVRSLVRDIGNDLGCGAVVVRLIRTKVGNNTVDRSVSLEKFLAEKFLS